VFFFGEVPYLNRILWEKMYRNIGFGYFFYKKNHFSEEKSPELSQVGRPSTALPCRGWRGGFENLRLSELVRRNFKVFYFNFPYNILLLPLFIDFF
jgi:hypothetical protein